MHYYKSSLKLFLFQWEWEWERIGIRPLLFGIKWELEYSLRFPKGWNGNGNEVMGMEGNGYMKVIPEHL